MPVVVHHGRSVIPGRVIGIGKVGPRTRPRGIEVARIHFRPSHDDIAKRRGKGPRIGKNLQHGARQIPPRPGGWLPHLRQRICALHVINVAGEHQYVSYPERGIRRIPTSVIHIGPGGPHVGHRIVDTRVRQARKGVGIHIAAGDEQGAVRHEAHP